MQRGGTHTTTYWASCCNNSAYSGLGTVCAWGTIGLPKMAIGRKASESKRLWERSPLRQQDKLL